MSRASLALFIALGLPMALAAQAPVPPAAQPGPQSDAPKPENIILAKVGDESITQADFDAIMAQLPQQQQMQILMVQGGREEFIRRIAESKVLAVKARHMGLGATPEFARMMARMEDDLLAREFLKKEGPELQKKADVKDEDVKAYYEGHLNQFHQPDLASVRHILISVKASPDAKEGLSDAEAKAKIAKIQRELKAGKKFEALAMKYSDDPGSKDKGGLYADADPSAWVPEFAKAAKEQPVGVVGKPIKTQFGYHIVKVESRKPARQIPFEEAKEQARQGAARTRQEQVWNQLMTDLRKEIPVEIVAPEKPRAEPSFQSIRTAPAKAEPAKPEAPAKAPAPAKAEAPAQGEVKK